MLTWLRDNLASLLAGLLVLFAVGLVIWTIIRDKKAGKVAGSIPVDVSSQSVYGFRKENQLIVLQYEHAGRPQADL